MTCTDVNLIITTVWMWSDIGPSQSNITPIIEWSIVVPDLFNEKFVEFVNSGNHITKSLANRNLVTLNKRVSCNTTELDFRM